jgi:hypothetical protein
VSRDPIVDLRYFAGSFELPPCSAYGSQADPEQPG